MIVCDTGPIVAAALVDDAHHHKCVELFTGLHLAGRPILVPGTVVAEVGYSWHATRVRVSRRCSWTP